MKQELYQYSISLMKKTEKINRPEVTFWLSFGLMFLFSVAFCFYNFLIFVGIFLSLIMSIVWFYKEKNNYEKILMVSLYWVLNKCKALAN